MHTEAWDKEASESQPLLLSLASHKDGKIIATHCPSDSVMRFPEKSLASEETVLQATKIEEHDDEGVEIVAWGKFDEMGDHQAESFEGTDGGFGGLSPLFPSSATVFVAFYRPSG